MKARIYLGGISGLVLFGMWSSRRKKTAKELPIVQTEQVSGELDVRLRLMQLEIEKLKL